jgi:hypothetical protein
LVTPIKLLWTGGWDSTYRLLDLVVSHGRCVQPHYVTDPRRRSTSHELAAMDAIRTEVARRFGMSTRALVLPLDGLPLPEIPPDDEITRSAKRLRRRSHLGDQYGWLARYAKHLGGGLELAVHRDDKAVVFLDGKVRRTGSPPPDDVYLLDSELDDPDLHLFRWFHFPLFEATKPQMEREARQRGFGPLMELTWFCHRPRRGEPCGACNPCTYTREEGLGRRVPRGLYRRLRRRAGALKGRLQSGDRR